MTNLLKYRPLRYFYLRVLSEPKPTEPTYTFYDQFGKPLPQKLADLVRTEYIAGRVQEQEEFKENLYGDPIAYTSRLGRLYQCTDADPDSEIPFGFLFRVKKGGVAYEI